MLSSDNMIHVSIFNISDILIGINDIERQRMLSLVSVDRKGKYVRKKKGRDTCLVAGYLLEQEIKRYLGIPFDYPRHSLTFGVNEYGKPYLTGEYEGCACFNMSHSGDYVIIAVGEANVGVDIEQCGKCDERIAKRFFAVKEAEYIENISDEELKVIFSKSANVNNPGKAELYTLYWTMKEAYMKWQGRGIGLGINSFTVNPALSMVEGVEEGAYTWGFTPDSGYAFSVYTDRKVKVVVQNIK